MKIEVWSDYVCPFCYIGKRKLEEALKQFKSRDQVEIVFKSFELDPNAPRDTEEPYVEILAKKYGMPIERAQQMIDGVAQQAKTVGLDFHLDSSKRTNTFDAHRLTKYAEKHGVAAKLTETLLQAYFTDSKHIGDYETLTDLAVGAGLKKEEVTTFLNSDNLADIVRAEEEEARQIGVQGVPFFVIDRKYAISGAQSPEVFLETLEKAWGELPLQVIQSNEGSVCTDEGCEITDK